MNEASSQHAGETPEPPQAEDARPTDAEEPDLSTSVEPLTEEQIALYRARMENGFYRTDEIRRQVAERLCGEVILDKRRR